MKIAWSIKIPKGAKLKVKNGSEVTCGDLIYEDNDIEIERLPLVGWLKLGEKERKSILQNIVKRELKLGEVLKNKSWFSSLIIKSPGKGKCLGVDEFGNIEFENVKNEKYFAPISAKKIRIEDEKLVFELKGSEFEGEGITTYKGWGTCGGQVIEDISQINSEQREQVVIVKSNLDSAIKAEAVGASGLILVDIDKLKEFEDCDIPVVSMKEEEVKKLCKFIDKKQAKIWLNANTGKVLVVLE